MSHERKAMYTLWDPAHQSWRVYPLSVDLINPNNANIESGSLIEKGDYPFWREAAQKTAHVIKSQPTYIDFSERALQSSSKLFLANSPPQRAPLEKGYAAKWVGATVSGLAGAVTATLSYFRFSASAAGDCVTLLKPYTPQVILNSSMAAYTIIENTLTSMNLLNANSSKAFLNSSVFIVNETLALGFKYLVSELEKNKTPLSINDLNTGILIAGLVTVLFGVIGVTGSYLEADAQRKVKLYHSMEIMLVRLAEVPSEIELKERVIDKILNVLRFDEKKFVSSGDTVPKPDDSSKGKEELIEMEENESDVEKGFDSSSRAIPLMEEIQQEEKDEILAKTSKDILISILDQKKDLGFYIQLEEALKELEFSIQDKEKNHLSRERRDFLFNIIKSLFYSQKLSQDSSLMGQSEYLEAINSFENLFVLITKNTDQVVDYKNFIIEKTILCLEYKDFIPLIVEIFRFLNMQTEGAFNEVHAKIFENIYDLFLNEPSLISAQHLKMANENIQNLTLQQRECLIQYCANGISPEIQGVKNKITHIVSLISDVEKILALENPRVFQKK